MSKRTHAEALQTKKSILEAAQRVFASKGFTKSSLSDIAREANVTRGAIYWHFENKSELFASLMEDEASKLNLVSTLRAAVEENQRDPLGTLKRWALMHFTEDAEVFFNSTLSAVFHSVISSEVKLEAREKLLELEHSRHFIIEEALRNAVVQKQLAPDIDVELAALYIQSTMVGLVLQIRNGMRKHPIFRYREIIECMFRHLNDIKRLPKPAY